VRWKRVEIASIIEFGWWAMVVISFGKYPLLPRTYLCLRCLWRRVVYSTKTLVRIGEEKVLLHFLHRHFAIKWNPFLLYTWWLLQCGQSFTLLGRISAPFGIVPQVYYDGFRSVNYSGCDMFDICYILSSPNVVRWRHAGN